MPKLGSILLAFFFFACSGNNETCLEAPDTTGSRVDVTIERLEEHIFSASSSAEVLTFLNKHRILKEQFLGSAQYPSDTILATELFRRVRNPYTDSLLHDAQAYFGNMKDLIIEFEDAFSFIKHFYPEFTPPKIQTMVTGFASSEMFVSDSLIIIGLDFYLGPDAKYRPVGIPDYILRRYDKSYIVPATILLYADRFLQETPSDKTMLADMIYYGKKYFFAKQMLPCSSDSLIVWYGADELKNVEENKDILWYHFLEQELLFETNHEVKQKYMDERPTVFEIGDKCPGRIGAWIGYDIVRTYMWKNKNIQLEQLMNNPDARDIFNKSGYRGG